MASVTEKRVSLPPSRRAGSWLCRSWPCRLGILLSLPLASSPAWAVFEGFDLRLSSLAARTLNASFAAIPLSLALLVITIYAAVVSILHVRARRAWNEHFEEQVRALRDTQAQAERASLFLANDRQLLIAWSGPGGEPEFDGDPGILLDTTNPVRAISFSEWLSPEDAAKLEARVFALKTEGMAFSEQMKSLRGDYVDIHGQPVSGRAVLSIRLATGERLALARIQDERDALATAQAQLRSVLEAIPQPVWLRDRGGRLGWVNTAYAQAVDAPGPDAVLSTQTEILDSEDRATIRLSQRQLGRYHGSVMAVMAGQRRKVDVVEVAGPSGGGGFALDISELEATKKALEVQIEAHVRTLDELPSAVAIFDQRQRLTYSNRAFAELFALDAAFLRSAPTNAEWLDRLRLAGRMPDAVDYREWRAAILAHYTATETASYGWRLPNGRSLRVVITPDLKGGLTYLFEDETERFTLAASYEELKTTQWETLMALSEGVAVFGSDGRLQLSNPAFSTIWGIAPEVLQGRPHIEDVGAACTQCRGGIWQSIVSVVCGLNDARDDDRFETTTPGGRTLSVVTTPLPDRATLLTVTDITDTVEAEQRLREHNEALTRAARLRTAFIKSISFELRSPLQGVVGIAQALAEGVAGPLQPKQLAYTQDLARAADAVLALTTDILELAGLETGGVDLAREDFEVSAAITEAMEGLKDRLGDAKVRLSLNVQTGLAMIHADPKHFRHIVFNLIANAISFSDAGDTVRLAVRREPEGLVIEVSDTGRGTSLQGGAQLSDSEREHGFRFSLARALVQLHGGRITMHDDPRGGHLTAVILPGA